MTSFKGTKLELVCPAGSVPMLRAAIEGGADSVYCGLQDETNARNFPGLNLEAAELPGAVRWTHDKGGKLLLAINTFAKAGNTEAWQRAVDCAARARVDAIIAGDVGVLAYAHATWPDLRLHLSVQAAAGTAQAVEFYAQTYGVKRVVLPRVLSVEEITRLTKSVDVEIEAFVYGGLCVMAEGRCALSSYATPGSPNLTGVCSPPESVSFIESGDATTSRLGDFAIDRHARNEPAGYPTLCKGRFVLDGEPSYLFEDPVSLNAMDMLASLSRAGVTAVKVEGRQRGKAYVSRVARAFRLAIAALEVGKPTAPYADLLTDLAEGRRETTGAYKKSWR
ncbi:MAG: protease [Asticcacaulis sp. 32-58-5]|nr:MAG: protease [Asticcacaulis sp. 32-58-5]